MSVKTLFVWMLISVYQGTKIHFGSFIAYFGFKCPFLVYKFPFLLLLHIFISFYGLY